jgi:hypothetical protein
VPFGTPSCGAAAAAISCCLLLSILQSFFCRQRTLEEVLLRLFWLSSVSILPRILETHHLAAATLIRRQAGESLKFSNNSALFRQKINFRQNVGKKKV